MNLIQLELFKTDEEIKKILYKNENFLTTSFVEYILSKSKKIRSIFTILVIKALYENITEKQIKICALTEIIHNATLIHDDIIDSAEIRRGKSCFNKIFDSKTAVIAGDFLLSLVLETLNDFNNLEIFKIFSEALKKVCLGEINQLNEKYSIPSPEEYLKKTENKTAELFKISLKSCLIAENQKENLPLAEELAKNFGTAFQIRDDILDFTGNKNEKGLENDLKNGIYTLPVIKYYELNPLKNLSELTTSEIKNSTAIKDADKIKDFYIEKLINLTDNFSNEKYSKEFIKLCKALRQ